MADHRGRRGLALDPARARRHARRRDRHRGGRGRRRLDRLAAGRGHPVAGAGHQAGAQRRACGAGAAAAIPRATSGPPARLERGRPRHVVANGFEADPGAQADRTLMETDPHAVVEGVALAAWAVRAHDAIIAVDARATGRHRAAARRRRGRRGQGLPGRPAPWAPAAPLRIEVRPLSGSFVLGEETVLLRALEDRRAQPDQRPPYPVREGPVGRADGRQQRRDPCRRALDRGQRRGRLRGDRRHR